MLRPIAVASSFVAVAFALTAGAQPDPGERAKREAKEHFDRGNQLLEEGEQSAALAEFLRSRELFPTRGNTKNAAVLLSKLGRYDEALEMFERYRELDGLTPEERAEIDREIALLKTRIGKLQIATEAGATVFVDDRERGTTPLPGPIAVAAGSHRLRIVKQGRVPFERRIDIAGQQTLELDAELVPVVGPAPAPPPQTAPAPVREPAPPARIEPAPAEPRISPFVALELGALVSPGLGGELAARCEGSCSAPLPLGAGAFVAGGVAFSSGLDVGAELGVLRLGASYEERPDPIRPVGYAGEGRANDDVTLTGIAFGGTVQLRTGKSVPVVFGFAAGVLAASVRDERTGPYTVENEANPAEDHALDVDVEQTTRGWYAYVGPEARVALPLSERLEVSLGLEVLVLFALSPPAWDGRSQDYNVEPVGITQFSGDTLTGNVLLIAMPGVGARYAF